MQRRLGSSEFRVQKSDFRVWSSELNRKKFKLRNFTIYFLLFAIYFLNPTLNAQIQTRLEPETILIGDTASLQITLTLDKNQTFEFPQIGDSLNSYIEVLDQKTDTLIVGNNANYIKNITITCFEPGQFLVNSLPIIIDGKMLQSSSLQLEVQDLEVEADLQKMFPIKDILPQEITWWEKNKKYVWYALGALLLAALIILIVWYVFREIKSKKYISKPLLPPFEEALDNLRKLDKEEYLKNEKYYEFYSDLSFILRRYFTRRFGFPANALLSQDLSEIMHSKEFINSKEKIELNEFLKDADLVKYGRVVPSQEKHGLYRDWVEDLIQHTRPILDANDENPFDDEEEHENLRKIDNS